VYQFPGLHLHRPFREVTICVDIPERDRLPLRIPRVEPIDVGARFAVDHKLVADVDRLAVPGPGELRVDFPFRALRRIGQLRIPFVGGEKCDRAQVA
jgi:hypothetical protein